MSVYGAGNSAAQQHEQADASSEQQRNTAVPALPYIYIYGQLTCKDLAELKGILDSISAPVANKDEEEKISLYLERNVENTGALITQMEKDMHFATAVTENAEDIQNEFKEMKKAIDSCVNILDKLGEKQFLSNDFINAVKMKMILLSPHVYDPTNNFKPNDIFRKEYVDFFQNKSYPYLLRGYFALYKAQDRKEAKKLFEKSAELGNEEGRVMSALCDHPKARELMSKVQSTFDRLNILAPRIINQQTASAHENELAALFDTLRFTVKMLNRSHLSAEDTVYAQNTWVPVFEKQLTQFHNEWRRIKTAQYFGSDKLKSSITGKSVELNMYFDIGTIIQGVYDQFLNQKKLF